MLVWKSSCTQALFLPASFPPLQTVLKNKLAFRPFAVFIAATLVGSEEIFFFFGVLTKQERRDNDAFVHLAQMVTLRLFCCL